MKRCRLLPFLLALAFPLAACGQSSGSSTIPSSEASGSLSSPAPTAENSTTGTTTASTFYDPETGITYENSSLQGKTAEQFELPLTGATGYASVVMNMLASADPESDVKAVLQPGDAFTILEEKDGHWWRIARDSGENGWVDNTCCYLNIPDVIPSIVIDNTNAYSSVFVSSGKSIPHITGEVLYDSLCYNARFSREQPVMAANYIMVKKIYAAQQAALSEGYTLILNETFRPTDVQLKVAAALKELSDTDPEVKSGIDQRPWGISWFISQRISTHQKGCAMDVSLGRVEAIAYHLAGDYKYPVVTRYTPCDMPTPIHELSAAAVSLIKPVSSASASAWKDVEPAASMTEDALRLKHYCTGAGMSPLASEWWHFNDLEAVAAIGENFCTDVYYINTFCSRIPE